MSLADAFAPIEAINREIVLQNTWGHLAPKVGAKHQLVIVFCWAAYGGAILPISMESETVEDSPFFYDDMQDFIIEKVAEQGKVYRFEGTYQKLKNGKARFSGKTEVIA